MSEATIEITGKSGVLSVVRVSGVTIAQAREIGIVCMFENDDGTLRGELNKRRVSAMRNLVARINADSTPAQTADEPAPSRIVVEAGRYRIGDVINGHAITGLGRSWTPNADQFSAYGISPSASLIQYAYFD